MGYIYWELPEIPIPPQAYVNKNDGRVFLMSRDSRNVRRRKSIGHATGNGNMHPNDTFLFLFPNLWKEHYGEKQSLPPHMLSLGPYATFLAIAERNGLYDLLHKHFGPLYGNAVMDYAMFSAADRSNSAHLFEDAMRMRVCFSKDRHADSWYSELFSKNLPLDALHQFKIDWIKQCAKQGCSKVWLCIDGSNNNCESEAGEINEFGKAKSLKDVPIVSYMWAVDAITGRPITWFVNPGNMIDAKAFRGIAQFLAASSISVEGLISDRGFCTQDVIDLAEECGLRYIIMLKGSTNGAQTLFERHGAEVRWNVRNILNKNGIFGTTDKAKIFANSSKENCIGLFFDGLSSAPRAVRFINKVLDCSMALRAEIAAGKPKVNVPVAMKKFIEIAEINGKKEVLFRYEAWQQEADRKGFYAIASSDELSAAEIHSLYGLRDASEKQFSMLKSQLGSHVTRVQSRQSIESKLAVAFIASVIRTEILIACRKLELDVNQMIRHCDRCQLMLLPDGVYAFVDNLSARLKRFLEEFGVTPEILKRLSEEMNARLSNPMQSQIRRLPQGADAPKPPRGRPRKEKSAEDDDKPRRKPGRPKGSKNKKTLERERLAAEAAAKGVLPPEKVKRKPGRPKGSKNKKTLEREARERALLEQAGQKRGRGRPKGSKNKATLEREAKEAAEAMKKARDGLDEG